MGRISRVFTFTFFVLLLTVRTNIQTAQSIPQQVAIVGREGEGEGMARARARE